MFSHKVCSLMAFAALITFSQVTSDAQWYSDSYTTFYGPSTSFYGGGYSNYAPSGGACCGTGSYTSYYGGGGYGNNPFAPLVPGPRFDLFAPFRLSRYRAAYAPYGKSCGCSPCATGGCATGNCGVTTNQPLKPTPDEPPTDNGNVPRTYDESDMPPMDDPAFRPSVPPENEGTDDSFPGDLGTESFKPPADAGDTPANESNPTVPLEANPAAIPKDQFDFEIPKPITPRNSAQFEPTRHLEHKITWRSSPVVIPSRQQLAKSRPLVVRQTVRIVPTQSMTVVSDSRPAR